MENRKIVKKEKSDGSKDMRKLLFSNNIYSSIKAPRLNTIYINTTKPNNLKIINKKNMNKREEILYTLNNKNSYPIFTNNGLPPISSQKSFNNFNSPNHINKNGNKFSFNVPRFEPRDKEGLIVELYHITNDMDNQNKEIENLTKKYNNLINNSLAYKIIIEKILGLDEEGNFINDENSTNIYSLKNREKSKSENNFKNINFIDEKEEFRKNSRGKGNLNRNKTFKNRLYNNSYYTNNTITRKNNKNKLIIKDLNFNDREFQTKIGVFLKQKTDLNRLLIEKERSLIKMRNDQKNKNFDEYLSLIERTNIELEELVNQSQKLQYEKYETEMQITSYLTKIKKITDEINTTSEKLKNNKNELQYNLKDIENLKKCKEELKQKEIKLNEEEKQNKNNFKEKQEKENKIDALLKEKKIYFEEQHKIQAQMKDLQKQEDNLKKSIDKKNLSIKGLQQENKDLEGQIKYYEDRRGKLLEKADQPRKNRIKMKEMENEIKDLEKNIVIYKVENDEKEKNMEETEEKNNELITNQEEEIKNHPNIVKELEEQINNLKKQLKEKENNNLKKGEELSKTEEEFSNKKEEAKQEKENMEKLRKEKEMQENNDKEMKNKQNEEKYNEFLKSKEELSNELQKLKEENNKIKEENKNTKNLHKEKMDLYKLASEKQLKLKQILNEIKDLSGDS